MVKQNHPAEATEQRKQAAVLMKQNKGKKIEAAAERQKAQAAKLSSSTR